MSCFDLVISILHFPYLYGLSLHLIRHHWRVFLFPLSTTTAIDFGDRQQKKSSEKNLENLFENPATLYIPTFTISFLLSSADNDLHLSFAIHLDLLRCFQLVASDGACDLIPIASSF